MPSFISTVWTFHLHRPACMLLTLFSVAAITSANEGFTDPYRTIHVAAPESGIISKVLVQEGTGVKPGQPLVCLDNEVHMALLAIAEAAKESVGQVDAAKAEVIVRRQRLKALEALRASGHARQEEVARARADLGIADGKLKAGREQQRLRQLEYEKIQVQISRRTICAPQDGVVTRIFKQAGEFTASNDPILLVLVQLDPLAATFDVPGKNVKRVTVGDAVQVKFTETDTTANALVEYISPVMNAESGTIAVKVRIPNPNGTLQSGQPCTLEIQ